MNETLHNEMLAGTLRAAGQFKRAAAIEQAAGRGHQTLSLANPTAAGLAKALDEELQADPDPGAGDPLPRAVLRHFQGFAPRSAEAAVMKWVRDHLEANIEKDANRLAEVLFPAVAKPDAAAKPTSSPAAPAFPVVARLSNRPSYLPDAEKFPHGLRLCLR